MGAMRMTAEEEKTSIGGPDAALLGRVVTQARADDPASVARAVLDALAVDAADSVLELGCGSGRALRDVAARVQRGFAAGVDPSELMVRHARWRNRRYVESGRVAIALGDSGDLSAFPDGRFDKAYGVHVVYFWRTPRRDLAEVARVLRPGGRLLLGYCPDVPGAAPGPTRAPVTRVEAWLREAGYADVATSVGERLAWTRASRSPER
jgi:SAM-dependent methyltransferase